MSNNENNKQLQVLSSLLQLSHNVIDSSSFDATCIRILNDTNRLISFDRASLFSVKNGTVKLLSVSGQSTVNENSQFAKNIKKVLNASIKELSLPHLIIENDALNELIPDDYFANETIYLIPLKEKSQPDIYFVWVLEFFDKKQINPKILSTLLGLITTNYADTLHHKYLIEEDSHILLKLLKKIAPSKNKLFFFILTLIILAIVSCFLIKIPYKATTRFEFTSPKSFVQYAPFSGIIKDTFATTGSPVSENQLILTYDITELLLDKSILQKNLEEISAKLDLTRSNALTDVKARSKMSILKLQQEQVKAKIRKSDFYIKNSCLKAPISGVLDMEEKNILQGRTVRAGDKLFKIAFNKELIATILLNETDAFVLSAAPTIVLHPNESPEDSIKTTLISISPFPILSKENGLFYYKIKVKIDKGNRYKILQGGRGIAAIYGEKVTLGYYITRNLILWWQQF